MTLLSLHFMKDRGSKSLLTSLIKMKLTQLELFCIIFKLKFNQFSKVPNINNLADHVAKTLNTESWGDLKDIMNNQLRIDGNTYQ